jgi:hypothetical protein
MVTITTGGELLLRERARSVISTGFRPLDALLPAGGVRPGSLVEWLAEGDAGPGGGGAASLAFAVACRLAAASGGEASEQARPRTIVVVDRTGWFHPPAVMPWLGDERRLVVARPSRDDDEMAAVLAWPRARVGRSIATRGSRPEGSLQQWSTAMRRWQLAAAASGAVGLFVRPLATRSESSWAETRIAVSPLPGGSHQSGGTFTERRLRLTLAGGSWAAVATDGQHATEVTLDLARGCAGAAPWDAGTPPRFAGTTRPAAVASGRSGVACRAS